MKWLKIILNVIGIIKPIYNKVTAAGQMRADNASKHSAVKKNTINTLLPKLRKKYGIDEDDLDTIIKFAVLIWKRLILRKSGSNKPRKP